VTSIPTSFGEENPKLLAKFLKVTADMNAKYAKDSAAMMGDIQKSAGMDLDGTKAVIGTFVFPTVAEQLSEKWMGGFVAKNMAESAASLEKDGRVRWNCLPPRPFLLLIRKLVDVGSHCR